MDNLETIESRERRSPVDNSITWSGRWATNLEVETAVESANSSFESWSRTTLEDRIEFAKKYASFLNANRDSISKTITLESGKPLWESLAEVQSAVSKVDNAIDAILKRRWTTIEGTGASASSIRFRPIGTMVVLGPYNLPLHLPGAHIVPALLAGNTMLFKPSEKSPAVGEWLVRAWQSADLPKGVLQCIHGAASQAKWAVDAPEIAGVLFTGSLAVGKQLHQQLAGRPECILALEMGGNNPLVVDRIKNRQAAIASIIQSAYITSGQRCTCARRLIVVEHPENEALVAELSDSISRIQIGNPLSNPQPFMGTLVSSEAATMILATQEYMRSQGGIVLNESRTVAAHRAMLTPGLILVNDETNLGKTNVDEEHFGPLLTITYAKNLDDAILKANRTRFGLAAGLLSDDAAAFRYFVDRVRAGIVNWNSPTTGASGKLPFGGVGASGNHRPSGYFASDYCSYPIASIENTELSLTPKLPPGLQELF